MTITSSPEGKRVLVTGASSFIGLRLCNVLAKRGAEVYGLVRESSSSLQSLLHLPDVRCVIGSIELIEDVLQDLDFVDIVFHLAWSGIGGAGRSDPAIQALNFSNSMNVLRHASLHGCTLFISGGSQAEYGRNHGGVIYESTACYPETEYGKAKLRFTESAIEFCEEVRMDHRMTRIFSVFGPGDHPWTLVSTLIRAMENREVLPISSCQQNWNFLFIDDAVDAMIALATNRCVNGIYNIASNHTQSLKVYVDVISSLFPDSPPPGFGMLGDVSAHGLNPSVDKLLEQTSWSECFTFEQGIRQTVEGLRQMNVKQ